MESKIVLLRLYNGEMIMGEKATPERGPEDMYTLDNPRLVAIMPSMHGGVSVAIGSVCEPFRIERLRKQISIDTRQVMFVMQEDEIETELVNGYKSDVSGIKIASAAETATINSANIPKPGEFIL